MKDILRGAGSILDLFGTSEQDQARAVAKELAKAIRKVAPKSVKVRSTGDHVTITLAESLTARARRAAKERKE